MNNKYKKYSEKTLLTPCTPFLKLVVSRKTNRRIKIKNY